MSTPPDLQPDTGAVLQEEHYDNAAVKVCVESVQSPVHTQAMPRKAGATRSRAVGLTPLKLLGANHYRYSATVGGVGAPILVAFSGASAQDPSTMLQVPAGALYTCSAKTDIWVAAVPGAVGAAGTPTANSGTFTAATAGSILLPAGASITGFDVTVAPATAAVNGVVTVTGVATANLNYQLNELTTGAQLSARFPSPIAPANVAATPQVNVPAITGGAAYAITVYGVTAAGATTTVTYATENWAAGE